LDKKIYSARSSLRGQANHICIEMFHGKLNTVDVHMTYDRCLGHIMIRYAIECWVRCDTFAEKTWAAGRTDKPKNGTGNKKVLLSSNMFDCRLRGMERAEERAAKRHRARSAGTWQLLARQKNLRVLGSLLLQQIHDVRERTTE
jgi:hypothetical protein